MPTRGDGTPRALVGGTLARVALAWLCGAPCLAAERPAAGLIVKAVTPHSAGAVAGVEPGDILTAWRRASQGSARPGEAGGPLVSPLDLVEIEVEQAPRGQITLTGRRGAGLREWLMPPGNWGLNAWPVLPAEAMAEIERGFNLLQEGQPRSAAVAFATADNVTEGALPPSQRAWLTLVSVLASLNTETPDFVGVQRISALLAEEGRQDLAAKVTVDVAAILRLAGRGADAASVAEPVAQRLAQDPPASLLLAAALQELAHAVAWEGGHEMGVQLATAALGMRQALAPGSVAEADSHFQLGQLRASEGDRQGAEGSYRRALDLLERLTPQARGTASVLCALAGVERAKDDLAQARQLFARCISILENTDPATLWLAAAYGALGSIELRANNDDRARSLFEKAAAIQEERSPESLDLARNLGLLGIFASHRGDARVAEELHRRQAAILQKVSPQSTAAAFANCQLGFLAQKRNDLAAADKAFRKCLSIRQELGPDTEDVASTLNSLGILEESRNDYGKAEEYYRRALAIHEGGLPESEERAATLSNLGDVALARNDLVAAEGMYRRSLSLREKLAPESPSVAWSLSDLGAVALARGKLLDAKAFYERCLLIQEGFASESLEVAQTLTDLGEVVWQRGEVIRAESFMRRALAMREKLAPDSPEVVESLGNVSLLLQEQGKIKEARLYQERALGLALVPAGLDLGDEGYTAWIARQDASTLLGLAAGRGIPAEDAATFLNNMALLEIAAFEFETAGRLLALALAIRKGIDPQGPDVAQSLNNLGVLAMQRGDLTEARLRVREAYELQRAVAPRGWQSAILLGTLAAIEMMDGDLAQAEEHEREGSELRQQLGISGGPEVARASLRLALIHGLRGDMQRAESHLEDAIAATEASGASSRLRPYYRALQAYAAFRGGQEERGLELARDALTMADGTEEADALAVNVVVAAVFTLEKDWATAESLYRSVLEGYATRGVGGVAAAQVRLELGAVLGEEGNLQEAEVLVRSAWRDISRILPDTSDEARAMRILGRLVWKRGDLDAAAGLLCGASTMANAQRTRIGGGDDARAMFTASIAEFHRDCEEALLELGRAEEALAVVEQSRARALLEMLAERAALLDSGIPEDLQRERRMISTEYDAVVNSLGALNPSSDADEITGLHGRLRELSRRREDLKARIRRTSPRLAALQYPEPLDGVGIRRALDPGTVYLSYSVGPERSWLYVLAEEPSDGRWGLTVIPLPYGVEALAEKVKAYRSLLVSNETPDRGVILAGEEGNGDTGDIDSRLMAAGRELYGLLIKPAEPQISKSRRILVSPAGPLHLLPFGALVRTQDDGSEAYLVQWRPVHFVISATVYAGLRRGHAGLRGGDERRQLVAFGDPHYPRSQDTAADLEVQRMARRGVDLTPLPFTRREVTEIAALFGSGGQSFVGVDATEARVKALKPGQTKYLHIASHGLLDEEFPLNSALALSIPEHVQEGEDNGLLQAWEIFEQVSLDADLVVLSACGTALGHSVNGEGLVGLTRAFQYAGARSIVASLWSVADESTSELMRIFYTNLKEGKTKDEALRQAQLSLLGDPATAHPFHWAAFQVIGDWQ